MANTNALGMDEAELTALLNGEEPPQRQEPLIPEENTNTNNQQPDIAAPEEASQAQPEAADQQAAQTPVNIDEELLKISGGALKSKDDLAALLEKSNSYTEFETRLKTYQDENIALKAQVNTEVFATPFMKGLNDLYKAGADPTQIKAYETLNRINLEELSPLDVRKLALQSRHGLTPEKAETYLKDEYKLDEETYDEATVATANIKLQIDSKADLDYLKSQKAESAVLPVSPDAKAQELEQEQHTQHIAKLKPLADNVINSLNFNGLSINGKQGADGLTADFEISEDSKKGLAARMEGYLASYGANLTADANGVKQMEDFAKNVLVLGNYQNWIINAASVREKQVRAEYHNPSGINRGTDNPAKGKTSTEEMGDWILQNAR